jgi:uncharacterized protein
MTADPGPECLVMAKPAGPACNLRCTYCYYTGKAALFPAGPWRMPEDLLERFIRQRIQASPGPLTHFEWHGGEPTLLGLEYFRRIARIQKAHCPPGRTVTNGLQTNGTLLDDAWADFLHREGYSVGLSLDGPAACHDAFRVTAAGEPTHARVLRSFRLLKERGVFCNVLCVLHAANAGEPDAVYDFFRGLGANHLQFLPLVIPPAETGASAAAPAEAVGAFLCRLFDRWIREDVGKIVIQAFDEALRPLYGAPHALCVHRRTCGDVAVLEHDGGFYACDHFVDRGHLIGNVREQPLAALARDPRMAAFGRDKRDSLPRACRECDVLSFCNGGCPKDRISASADGEPGLNRLCPAYKSLFTHARPELARLAAHMKAGGRLRAFTPL